MDTFTVSHFNTGASYLVETADDIISVIVLTYPPPGTDLWPQIERVFEAVPTLLDTQEFLLEEQAWVPASPPPTP